MASNGLSCSRLDASMEEVAVSFLVIINLVFTSLSLLWFAILLYIISTTKCGKDLIFMFCQTQFPGRVMREEQNIITLENMFLADKSDRKCSVSSFNSSRNLIKEDNGHRYLGENNSTNSSTTTVIANVEGVNLGMI